MWETERPWWQPLPYNSAALALMKNHESSCGLSYSIQEAVLTHISH